MKLVERAVKAFDERTGLITALRQVALHPIPPGTGWSYVFGSAVMIALIIQVVTGTALAMGYVSSAGEAYQALQFITNNAFMGNFLRGMHFFGASAMVLLLGIHMTQVFVMGCYKYPRELNWITGVALLILVVAIGFTGQLLRWDQVAVWAVVVAAEQASRVPILGASVARFILGGDTIGAQTLSRFFALHVFFIPGLIFAFVGIHLLLVLHDGISEPPVLGEKVDPKTYLGRYHKLLAERGVPFWPDAAWRDVVFGFAVVVAIALLALFVGAPRLGEPPNPSLLAQDPAPDWYLLWYYAALALIPHGLTAPFIVLAPLLGILIVLVVPPLWNRGERHPLKRPWAVAATIIVWLMVGTLWLEGIKAPWSPRFEAKPLPVSVVGVASGPVYRGAVLFHDKGCEFCHAVAGYGGARGPDLSTIGDDLTRDEITIRILNGGYNMPAYAAILRPDELSDIVAFLQSRSIKRLSPAQQQAMAAH
jgi:ubiquinol-cytochrome c reductase cytochrome b subunit